MCLVFENARGIFKSLPEYYTVYWWVFESLFISVTFFCSFLKVFTIFGFLCNKKLQR